VPQKAEPQDFLFAVFAVFFNNRLEFQIEILLIDDTHRIFNTNI